MCIFYLGNGSYSLVGLGPPGVFHSLSFRIPGANIFGDGIIATFLQVLIYLFQGVSHVLSVGAKTGCFCKWLIIGVGMFVPWWFWRMRLEEKTLGTPSLGIPSWFLCACAENHHKMYPGNVSGVHQSKEYLSCWPEIAYKYMPDDIFICSMIMHLLFGKQNSLRHGTSFVCEKPFATSKLLCHHW